MKKKLSSSNLYLTMIGLGALIWFLIRVIPKPSRGNLHWQNADYFGTVKLVSETPTVVLE